MPIELQMLPLLDQDLEGPAMMSVSWRLSILAKIDFDPNEKMDVFWNVSIQKQRAISFQFPWRPPATHSTLLNYYRNFFCLFWYTFLYRYTLKKRYTFFCRYTSSIRFTFFDRFTSINKYTKELLDQISNSLHRKNSVSWSCPCRQGPQERIKQNRLYFLVR